MNISVSILQAIVPWSSETSHFYESDRGPVMIHEQLCAGDNCWKITDLSSLRTMISNGSSEVVVSALLAAGGMACMIIAWSVMHDGTRQASDWVFAATTEFICCVPHGSIAIASRGEVSDALACKLACYVCCTCSSMQWEKFLSHLKGDLLFGSYFSWGDLSLADATLLAREWCRFPRRPDKWNPTDGIQIDYFVVKIVKKKIVRIAAGMCVQV